MVIASSSHGALVDRGCSSYCDKSTGFDVNGNGDTDLVEGSAEHGGFTCYEDLDTGTTPRLTTGWPGYRTRCYCEAGRFID